MTHTTPTPAEFLAFSPNPDEDEDFEQLDPLADFQRRLSELETAVYGAARQRAQADVLPDLMGMTDVLADECNAQRDQLQEMHQAYADLEAKYEAVNALVDDVLAVCKPSVSKLANQVRETVARWRSPEVPVAEPADRFESEPAPAWVDTRPVNAIPAHDAPVEVWREFARSCGAPVDEPDAIDSMNRSQIRTMLGIAHGGAE